MLARLLALPFIVIVMGIGAAAMFLPAIHAWIIDADQVARAFFYSGILFSILFILIAVATQGADIRHQARSHLMALLATFTVMPVMLAVPFYEALDNTSFLNAYVEMVSSLTTTGAPFFDADRVPLSAHLWRGLVAWMGGFFVWVTAVAILAPLNLGGFEVGSSAEIGQGAAEATQITRVADAPERITRFAARLFPVYASLTVVLWTLLIVAGETPTVAIMHAMATISTSGITPLTGFEASGAGIPGEAIVFLFLVFALSRMTYAADERPEGWRSLTPDPELKLGLVLVITLPILLFLRHWAGAFEVDEIDDLGAGLAALWGGMFTVMSFLTTTGFESGSWDAARTWSGLETPGLILMGLCVFGGGVATTAGGVKLLRVYALFMHGQREMEKLMHPSSIGGAGQVARRIRRKGAYAAWIFFMLFALSIAVTMVALSLFGLDFEEALILTIAALTTTGPLTDMAAVEPVALETLSAPARLIMAAAMVLGRLETLAIIALLNPDFWRA